MAVKRTEFDVSTGAAAAFLTLIASQQTVVAAQAAVDRAQMLVRSVKASVDAQLRPGADLSRADTELDAAETQLIQSEQAVEVAKAAVARYVGGDPKTIQANPGKLLESPADSNSAPGTITNNPAAREQNAIVEESRARLEVLQRTYRPKFDLQLGAFARGTGALPNGATLGGWNGLAPNYFNAGAGFTVDFSALALPSIHAQEAQEAAIGRSAAATYRQVLTDVQAQLNAAQATLTQARRIAAETPKEVADAQTGFNQANARYRAGLTNIVEIAEAQRLLAQAEIDDSLAKLAIWRALLENAIMQGDITSFLSEASH
jgi:outer membrane protein TolC